MKSVPLQALITALLLTAPGFAAGAVDDYKVIKLEQDVRKLEQQVRELMRQVDELRRKAGPSVTPNLAPPSREPAESSGSLPWLQADNWQRLQIGMSDLQVIQILGPPTSTRAAAADPGGRVLFYALEIGAGSFLSGSVELRDHRVVEISQPVLK